MFLHVILLYYVQILVSQLEIEIGIMTSIRIIFS